MIKVFNKKYDDMLSIFWGIDDEKLKKNLQKYPQPLDLSILKSGTVTLQMLQPLILKKIEQITATNSNIRQETNIIEKYINLISER